MGVDATTSGWSPGVVKQHIVRMIDKIFSSRLVSPWCSEKIAEYHTALWLTDPSVMYNSKTEDFSWSFNAFFQEIYHWQYKICLYSSYGWHKDKKKNGLLWIRIYYHNNRRQHMEVRQTGTVNCFLFSARVWTLCLTGLLWNRLKGDSRDCELAFNAPHIMICLAVYSSR